MVCLLVSKRALSSHIDNKIITTYAQVVKTLVELLPTSPDLLSSPAMTLQGGRMLSFHIVPRPRKINVTELKEEQER